MALRIYKEISKNKVRLKQGHFYKFKYSPYQNDPSPILLWINAIKGTHPTSGKQWNLIQGINLNYISRRERRQFVDLWKKEMERTGRFDITWDRVKRQFPYMQKSFRRYLLSPAYYIRDLEYIPYDKVDQEVTKSWFKDFSSTVTRRAGSFFKRMFAGRR